MRPLKSLTTILFSLLQSELTQLLQVKVIVPAMFRPPPSIRPIALPVTLPAVSRRSHARHVTTKRACRQSVNK